MLNDAMVYNDFLPSTHASRNGQAMWDTIPLGTLFGLPCVLIYVFTDEFILLRRTTPLVGEVGADPTVPLGKGVTDPRVCRFAILR